MNRSASREQWPLPGAVRETPPPSTEDLPSSVEEGLSAPTRDGMGVSTCKWRPWLSSSGPAEVSALVFEQRLRTEGGGPGRSASQHSHSPERHPAAPRAWIPLNKAISS